MSLTPVSERWYQRSNIDTCARFGALSKKGEHMRNFWGLVGFCCLLGTALFAQQTAINGTVMDPSGAVIPKAAVTITNTQTGQQRSDVSDSQGRYTIPQLPPGTYKVTATASGFSEVTIQRIELLVNSPATVPIRFEKVGSTSTTVSVEASAAQINTVDASIGNVITSQAIVELPSFARNVANLLSFQPGVAFFGGTDDRNGSVNGGRSRPVEHHAGRRRRQLADRTARRSPPCCA